MLKGRHGRRLLSIIMLPDLLPEFFLHVDLFGVVSFSFVYCGGGTVLENEDMERVLSS